MVPSGSGPVSGRVSAAVIDMELLDSESQDWMGGDRPNPIRPDDYEADAQDDDQRDDQRDAQDDQDGDADE